MDLYIGTPDDDILIRSQWWFPGEGISNYIGGLGYDTLNFSGVPGGMTYFYGGQAWVQDRNIPLGFYDESIGQDIYAFAWIGGFEKIVAGSGADTFYLLSGVMEYDGGDGNDTFVYESNGFNPEIHLEGNLGDDVLDFTDDSVGITYDLDAGTLTNYRDWVATVSSVESIFAGSGDDILIPGADTLYMNGGDGDDLFDISAGVLVLGQTFIGGEGTDTFSFSDLTWGLEVDLETGLVTWGDTGAIYAFAYEFENAAGGRNADTILGTDGRNEISGGGGDDHIEGAGGRDLLRGQAGDDTILGGAGRDRIYGQTGNDDLRGGAGADKLFGGNGDDIVRGGGGNDTLRGGQGDDTLSGGRGNDEIRGGAGEDVLIGGRGDDILFGGADGDTFRFADDHGNDTIVGFDAASTTEFIDFSRVSDIASMSDLIAATVDTADGALITTGAESSVLVYEVSLANLSNFDFIFV